MRTMSKIYCKSYHCPVHNCDRNMHFLPPGEYRTEELEGTLLCIKPLDKCKKIDGIPVPTESDEQQALFDWADKLCFRYPELALLYHIPNEGKRSKTVGARLKREGMKSGVPDIHLPVPNEKYHSLYIELKRRKGSSTTTEQKVWLQLLCKYGNKAVRCYGWEEAAKVITEYLEMKEEK